MMASLRYRDHMWVLCPRELPAPMRTLVVEATGGIFEWPLDDDGFGQLTFTDVCEATWLWRLVGQRAYEQIIAAIARGVDAEVDLAIDEAVHDQLRGVAYGHWLRRWWPSSQQTAIPALEGRLVDAELAVRTAELEEFLAGGLDGDPLAVLSAHGLDGVEALSHSVDPRVRTMAGLALAVIEDFGGLGNARSAQGRGRVRREYALAATGPVSPTSPSILRGVSSLHWQGVPNGLFDGAERTISWSMDALDAVHVQVAVLLLDPSVSLLSAEGIPFSVMIGELAVTGTLDASGRGETELPVPAKQAWQLSPGDVRVQVGVPVEEAAEDRASVREFARRQLGAGGLFLAERVAADYEF